MAAAPKPPVVQAGTGNSIIVNPCQRLNPLLDCIRNVSKEFGDIIPDFQLGRTTCALFLSLKYHRLHPEYIHQRIEKLGNMFSLRILMLLCDVTQHQDAIREITKTCLINNITVMVAWSNEEAGAYLSSFKAFEHKPPDMIKERLEKDFNSMYRTSLTTIPKVNKTDVETLRSHIGSIASVATASAEQMHNLPGLGQVKVRRIKDAFEKPFWNNSTNSTFKTRESADITRPQIKENQPMESESESATTNPQQDGRGRATSPTWDIELDPSASLPDSDVPV
ncbi:DNA repair protein rad10 [Sistotremastrum suecicum HHB10207 ss-3]|uniref:DNA repair protein rad10 n=1 Tax=Sistotremastrum suecicum HHB10207 ss-3 TaxID=1314776 RepID=A0A166I9V1_9AGAM|nr:DNA repair protein rad10 [Sistotremastrum suecicum HHB10207 ss-3]